MLGLVTPGFGLTIWMLITFVILMVLLKKLAWKPILGAINERETKIEGALAAAEKAKEEMAELNAKNDELRKVALAERDALMKEAREMKTQIISDAKTKAGSEADTILASARETISQEKAAAQGEIKSQVASLSIAIAEKLIKGELSTDDKQKALVDNLVNDVNLN
jgi:F-type H+-transporting ATPase subunit b